MALLPDKISLVPCRSDSWLTSFSSYLPKVGVTHFFPASTKLFLSWHLLLPDLFHSKTEFPDISFTQLL